jgi:hypothetical protein
MEETRVPKENHSFSIMGNNSSIEWDVIECLLYGECHAPLCLKDKLKKLLQRPTKIGYGYLTLVENVFTFC